ncbi:MAG: hypothetical protein IIB41_01490 [Candidatus Marinimicrobia bacterium]|nr:hypothetical protein [Candidatus Neomarinimicrobiota bacterium]
MTTTTSTGSQTERVHVTLPMNDYVELLSFSKGLNMKYLDAIREAIVNWNKAKKSELRREGYLARAEEDLGMMAEFKQIDGEIW